MSDLFISSVFFTLFFVVDPLGQIPIFIVYLSGHDARQRRKIILKAIAVSIAVSFFFILCGDIILKFMGISSGAFLIAGGILLFLISMDMLFARPSRTKVRGKEVDGASEGDISVFPLAIPFLCGPGNIAALLMFTSQVRGDAMGMGVLMGITVIIFLITMVIMFLCFTLEKLLGETGISVIQRLIGLILSALAIQFVADGLKQIKII